MYSLLFFEDHPEVFDMLLFQEGSDWTVEELTRDNAYPYKLFTEPSRVQSPQLSRGSAATERDTRVALSDSLLQPDFSL